MSMMKGESVLHFSLLDGLFWAFFACFGGLVSAYFLACGMANTTLSITLAGYMLASFVGSFVLGQLCDRLTSNRSGMQAAMIFAHRRSVLLRVTIFPSLRLQGHSRRQ